MSCPLRPVDLWSWLHSASPIFAANPSSFPTRTGFAAILFSAVAVAGVAWLVLRPPAVVRETTKYMERKKSPAPQATNSTHLASPAPVPSQGGRSLIGINPETGKDPSISFAITPSLVQSSGGKIILGRKREVCHLHIPSTSVSGQHATLFFDGDTVKIQDRNSSNGTRINGGPQIKPFENAPIRLGDRIQLGEVTLNWR